jgi:hypothetical protein
MATMSDDERAFDASMTLGQASTMLRGRMDKGAPCPCCGQFAKIYRRKINSGMAYGMVLFFKKFGWDQQWVHVPRETSLSRLGGDWAKLALWGLIEERGEVREDGGKHAGWWRITEAGVAWVSGRIRVPRFVNLYNGEVLGVDGDQVSIKDAIGDRFNYDELMKGVVLPPPPAPPVGQLRLF